MEKLLDKTLIALGLNNLERIFFITSFKLGPTNVVEIAKAAKIRRSTAYLIAQNLLGSGILLEDHKEYGKKVFALDPHKLLSLLSERQNQLNQNRSELENNLPELLSEYKISDIRPKVTIYEGKSGLTRIWQDILSAKTELCIWTNQESETQIFDARHHEKFIAERVKKNIYARVLTINNNLGKKLQEADSQFLRKTKLLPSSNIFTAETYLYDSKIAILDYKKDIIGILIESEPISTSHKAIFELVWNTNA